MMTIACSDKICTFTLSEKIKVLLSVSRKDLNQVKQGFRRCPNLKDQLCRIDRGRTHWDPKRAREECTRDDCETCSKKMSVIPSSIQV